LIGCLGYLHAAHLLITDNALAAGIAMALYGLAIIVERPGSGAMALGTGAGIAFLSKGLIGPGMLGLTALTLAALPTWRTRSYARSLMLAGLAFAPWVLLWPLMLYRESPQLFNEWLVVNNFGRYTRKVDLGPAHDHFMYLKILPWFALPALPLAAWNIWNAAKAGNDPWRKPQLQLPLVAACVMLVVLSVSCSSRNLYAVPMLLPLSVLAAAGAAVPPGGLAAALRWLAIAVGAVLALGIWGCWLALLIQWPSGIVEYLNRPGFVPRVEPLMTMFAIGAMAGWLLLLRAIKHSADAVVFNWAASVTLAWVLFTTLWLSYQDFGNSYRSAAAEIRARMPAATTCIASRELGETERAMLQYFAGIVTRRQAPAAAGACELLLVQSALSHSPGEASHPEYWSLLWAGNRPGDIAERLWLFRRVR
jgi:4-amino-4-deoxy-L-arabinose transferase-like glycosyltransferase